MEDGVDVVVVKRGKIGDGNCQERNNDDGDAGCSYPPVVSAHTFHQRSAHSANLSPRCKFFRVLARL
jgi:hypothetical protein